MARARKLAVLVGLAVIATLAAVPAAYATPNNKVDIIRGQGSDTTLDLMQNLARAYNNTGGCEVATSSLFRLDHECLTGGPPWNNGDPVRYENWDHDVAVNFFAIGSGNGIRMLSAFGQPGVAKIDFARSSRVKSGSDLAGLRFVAYAKDALTWFNFRGTVDPATCDVDRTNTVFPEFDDSGPLNPADPNDGTWPDGPDAGSCNDATVASSVTNLTTQQIKDIHLDCAPPITSDTDADGVMTWKDLDSTKPAIPIIRWTSQAGSGTRPSWDGFVGGNTDTCIPANFKDSDLTNGNRVIFEHDATPVVRCATDDDGTGPETIDCPDENAGDGFAVHYTQSIYHYGVGAFSQSGTNPLGQGADLGNINGIAPTTSPNGGTIGDGTFPYSRDVFNVYRNTVASGNNASEAVKDFVGEGGWICKLASQHVTNPKTGANFREQVEDVIEASGFVPIGAGPTGGGVGGNSHCRVS